MQSIREIFDRQIARLLLPLVSMGFTGMLITLVASCLGRGKSIAEL